jgi:hypothetical protein
VNQPDPLQDLIDDYLDGLLDEARLRELDERLYADPTARQTFVRYARLHTDLHLETRARLAGARALDRIVALAGASPAAAGSSRSRRVLVGVLAAAAGLLLAIGTTWRVLRPSPAPDTTPSAASTVAWLVNAQNCVWRDAEPTADMRAGTVLKLERGLAEIRFQGSARVLLEGPTGLELLSGQSARLLHGKLTARAGGPAAGFEILSPQGKLIDRGTEFGIAVATDGATDVYVFDGRVEAHPTGGPAVAVVNLTRNQSARLAAGAVTLRPAGAGVGPGQFVRAIVPPPLVRPRTWSLHFDHEVPGSITDAAGLGTGLIHRLPGTGGRLPRHDPHLRLDTAAHRLELTTTNSDLNTQFRVGGGEYLGVRLSDLGFTGKEDFAVTVTIPNIPALEVVGQFGLHAGVASDRTIRGGLISRRRGEYTQFLVNNDRGRDADIYQVGLLATGNDLRLTLKRTAGRYSLTVANLTTGATSALTIRHPAFLDGQCDLYVGLFGANTQSEVQKTLTVTEFQVTVWTATSPVSK